METRTLGAAATALLKELQSGPKARAALIETMGLSHRQVTNAAANLLRRGYLSLHEGVVYQLTEAGLAAALAGEVIKGGPKGQVKIVKGTIRQRAWCAMRIRRSFTIGEIVADAAEPDEGQPRDNIGRFLSRLAQAGYVRELERRARGTAIGSNGFKRYALVRNTGPKAPVFRSELGVVFDPNLGEDVPCVQA
jgi:hypothetical protein